MGRDLRHVKTDGARGIGEASLPMPTRILARLAVGLLATLAVTAATSLGAPPSFSLLGVDILVIAPC